MTADFSFECLQGENPDILRYLIRRDGRSWMIEVGQEIEMAQRQASDKGRTKKSRKEMLKYAAHLMVIRDRILAAIERGSF